MGRGVWAERPAQGEGVNGPKATLCLSAPLLRSCPGQDLLAVSPLPSLTNVRVISAYCFPNYLLNIFI